MQPTLLTAPILTASLLALGLPAQGNVLRVAPNDPNAYPEIQAAVDAAPAGAEILVAPGDYGPVVVRTDGLTIRAAPATGTAVVDAAGALEGILIDANAVSIVGLTVTGASGPNPDLGDGITIRSGRGNRISRCTVHGNNSFGIGVVGGSGHVVEGCEAYDNAVGLGFSTFRDTGIGNASDSVIRKCSAHDNRFDGFLHFRTPVRNAFVLNIARNNGRIGFYVTESSQVTLRWNISVSNADGFNTTFTSDLVLAGNYAADNTRHGFAVRETVDSSFARNVARENAANGFSINDFSAFPGGPGPSIDNSFVLNWCVGNAGFGFFVDPTCLANEFVLTRFSGNGAGDSNLPLD